jgi:hypothetical protein
VTITLVLDATGLWKMNAVGRHNYGAYTVTGSTLAIVDLDARCHLTPTGTYTWVAGGSLLTLTVVRDDCDDGARAFSFEHPFVRTGPPSTVQSP